MGASRSETPLLQSAQQTAQAGLACTVDSDCSSSTPFCSGGVCSEDECTICDDPADLQTEVDLDWCHDDDCVTTASPQDTDPNAAGYCPAVAGRIAQLDLSNCGDVTEAGFTDGVKFWYADCNEGRVAQTSETDCAYVIPNQASGALGQVGKICKFPAPIVGITSMAYEIGDTGRYYQAGARGVCINSQDGSTAYVLHALKNRDNPRSKDACLHSLTLGDVESGNLYPTQHPGWTDGTGSGRQQYYNGSDDSTSALLISKARLNQKGS